LDKVAVADNIQFILGRGAAHIMEELPIHIDTGTDEVQELLHMVNAVLPVLVGLAGRLDKIVDVLTYVSKCWFEDWLLCKVLTQLPKDPWVADA
jgi:hypothetical protein